MNLFAILFALALSITAPTTLGGTVGPCEALANGAGDFVTKGLCEFGMDGTDSLYMTLEGLKGASADREVRSKYLIEMSERELDHVSTPLQTFEKWHSTGGRREMVHEAGQIFFVNERVATCEDTPGPNCALGIQERVKRRFDNLSFQHPAYYDGVHANIPVTALYKEWDQNGLVTSACSKYTGHYPCIVPHDGKKYSVCADDFPFLGKVSDTEMCFRDHPGAGIGYSDSGNVIRQNNKIIFCARGVSENSIGMCGTDGFLTTAEGVLEATP